VGGDARAVALDRRLERARAAPVAAPDAEADVEERAEGEASVPIAGADERHWRAELALLVVRERERPVHRRIRRARQIVDAPRCEALRFGEERALLDREEVVVSAEHVPPVREQPLVLDEPERAQHAT